MDFSIIGQRIRELRKSLKLSQEELAAGICTQAQISKIEKGDVFPYSNTLYLISQKLGVDVNYFFEIGSTPRIDYVNEVFRQLRLARRSLQFEEMERIIKLEEKNPLFTQNNRHYQMILWNKGLCEHALHKNTEGGIKILWKAIELTHTNNKVWTEREIEILIAVGSIYSEEGRTQEAFDIFLGALENLEQLVFISDNTILPRLYYNLARVYSMLDDYDKSNYYCQKGIKYCLSKDALYPLGELHYQICYNYEKQLKFKEALSYLNKSVIIFDLLEDKTYLPMLEEGRNFLLEKIGEQQETDHAL